MSDTRSSAASGMALALAGAFFYGFNITFAKISAEMGVSGPMLVTGRVLVMIALALGVGLIMRASFRVPRDNIGAMILLGLGSTGVSICYLSSVAFIPITVAAVIFYTFPILIVLAAPFVDKKTISPALAFIVALAFIGVVLVLGMTSGDLDYRGILLATGASLSAAMQFFAGTRIRGVSTASTLMWTQIIVLPFAAGAMHVTDTFAPMSTFVAASVPVWLTIGGFVFGYGFQILALARISASVAGLAFCLEPVVAALTSAIVLGERLAPIQYFGGSLVIIAIIATVVLERREQARAAKGV